MRKQDLLNEKSYLDLNIHERIAVKAWWNVQHGNLILAAHGGYYFDGYFITGKKYIQSPNALSVK